MSYKKYTLNTKFELFHQCFILFLQFIQDIIHAQQTNYHISFTVLKCLNTLVMYVN